MSEGGTRIRFSDLTFEQRAYVCNGCGKKGSLFKSLNWTFGGSCDLKELDGERVVYLLVSPSGRPYVGQTRNIRRRLREYRNGACVHQRRLRFAIAKHGFDAFIVGILERCATDDELDALETKWISALDSTSLRGLNAMTGGGALKRHTEVSKEMMSRSSSGPLNPMWGGTHTAVARAKISAANKGRKRSRAECERISRLHKGKPKSAEQKAKMSEARCCYFYTIIDPAGNRHETRNLSSFCKRMNLSEWGMGEVARGKKSMFRGWAVKRKDV